MNKKFYINPQITVSKKICLKTSLCDTSNIVGGDVEGGDEGVVVTPSNVKRNNDDYGSIW